MEKKFVSIGNETLAYLDEGQGDVVLMLHGNMSSSVHYGPLIERLRGSFRCIAPDLRGFGDSSYNNRFDTMDELAEDVKNEVDRGVTGNYYEQTERTDYGTDGADDRKLLFAVLDNHLACKRGKYEYRDHCE